MFLNTEIAIALKLLFADSIRAIMGSSCHLIRMLFPVWALTGLKFVFPYLISFPLYVTKTELTTVTLFYDAYYDFGILGVGVFSCLLGLAAFWLVNVLKNGKSQNPMWYVFYGQFGVYMMLSFFTTWFSNPTTWFYLAVTGAMAWYCGKDRGRRW